MPNDEGVGADGRGAAMRALFDAAIGHGPDDRTAFLRETARRRGVDEELIDEVVGLLAFVDATRIDDNTTSDADAPDRLVGCRLGSFTLDRLVGIGGTAAVFEATQAQPRRTVAVKVLRQTIAGPRARRRFEREIEIAGRLEHPAIARVLDSGTMRVDGFDTPWLAMEFVPDARTITRYANEENVDLQGRIRLVRSALAGVAAAHRRGVIHRDLKPANVLVDPNGRVRVIDFGIARQFEGATAAMTATVPGQVIGTIPFMAPEQLGGDSDAVDVRTDVYAIGVLLHLLLTGRMPYETADCSFIEAARRIREVEVGSLRRIDRRIDGDLDGIVQKGLTKNPDARYRTIEALDADLAAWLEGMPVTARPLGAAARTWRLIRRRPFPAAFGVLAFVSVLIVIVVLAVMLARETELRARGDRAVADAGIAAAMSSLQRNDFGGAARHLDMVPESERGWEHVWLSAVSRSSDRVLPHERGDVIVVDLLPAEEGRPPLLLATGYRGTWAYELPDATLRWHQPGFSKGGSWKHVLMPDGERVLAVGLGPEFRIFDLDTGEVLASGSTPGSIGSLWALGDERALFGGDDGMLTLFDLETATVLAQVDPEASAITSMLGLPDGRIIVGSGTGKVIVVDRDLGSLEPVRDFGRMVPRMRADATFERIAICTHDDAVDVVDAATFETIIRLDDHLADVWDARFDQSGRRLVTACLDESVRVFDLETGETLERISGPHDFVWSLAVEPDGDHAWIGTRDGSIRRVPLLQAPVLMPEGETAGPVAFSPDGRSMAVRTDRRLRVLYLDSRDWTAELPIEIGSWALPGKVDELIWTRSGIWFGGGEAGGLRWYAPERTSEPTTLLAGESVTSILGLADDGVLVAVGTRELVRLDAKGRVIERVETSQKVQDLEVHPVTGILHALHVGRGAGGERFTLSPLTPIGTFDGWANGAAFDVAIDPTGRWVVTGGRERPGNVWVFPYGRSLDRLSRIGHAGDVRFAAFLDGGRRTVTAGEDGRVLVARLDDTRPLITVFESTQAIRGMAVSPDGRSLAATDGTTIFLAIVDSE